MSTIIRNLIWLLIPMILFCGSVFFGPFANAQFSDVEVGDGHYMAINYIEEKGYVDGYEDGTFRAYENINRAEALKILTLASGIFNEEEIDNSDEIEERPFEDTPTEAWFTKYLVAAKEGEIIHGYEDDTFRPHDCINLAETLKIYLESFENLAYPLSEQWLFEDTPLNEWFTKYTAYAGSRGMLDVWPSNKIYPDQDMTRGYLAELIYRKEKFKEGYRFGKATFYGSAVQGNYTASGEIFDMNKFTAAHKTLAFGTMVEVTNLANGKSVIVKINDRGPYGPGRVLDLSSGAFAEIASLGTGIIHVQYKVVN